MPRENLAKVLGILVKSKTAASTAASFCFDKQAIKNGLAGWVGEHSFVNPAQRSQKFKKIWCFLKFLDWQEGHFGAI